MDITSDITVLIKIKNRGDAERIAFALDQAQSAMDNHSPDKCIKIINDLKEGIEREIKKQRLP